MPSRGPRRVAPLLALSPARVAGAIEQVPTIRLASVDRDFPHTLRIRIVPERAVALAVGRRRATAACVAASGRVLRVFERQEAVPALPRVWTTRERPVPGSAIHSVSAQAALDALAARPRDFSARVANVKIDPERGIVMRLRGGLDIVLGPPLQLRDKLRAAAWVLRRYPTTRRSRAARVRRRLGAGAARCHATWRLCAHCGAR